MPINAILILRTSQHVSTVLLINSFYITDRVPQLLYISQELLAYTPSAALDHVETGSDDGLSMENDMVMQ